MHAPQGCQPPHHQRGVVLIVALLMLLAIALLSVSVMRGALNNHATTLNQHTQALAMESAHLALQLCEQDLRLLGSSTAPAIFTTAPGILPASTDAQMAWEQKNNWVGTGAAVRARPVPLALLKSKNTRLTPAQSPQCLAEYSPSAPNKVIVLTVRGFSPDYSEDPGTHQLTSGSVVWLQSQFVFDS